MQDILLKYFTIVGCVSVAIWIGAEIFDHYFPKEVVRPRGATRNNPNLNTGE